MNPRKVCVVTGSRAEYGLMRWLMEDIHSSPDLELQLIATGTHLASEFGLTYREIEVDGFKIDRRLEIGLGSDTPAGIARSMGSALTAVGQALEELQPDLLLVLGDRFEIFAAVAAAMIARVPVAHLQGGEATEGSFDEALRHCITKMSHLHFVAAEDYRRRVMQLGEQPQRVFVVGGLGVDVICRTRLLGRAPLEDSLGIRLAPHSLLVTFHPATLDEESAVSQMAELLAALDALPDVQLIFTMPNADPQGRALATMVGDYVARRPGAHVFTSLGQLRYLSCLRQVDGVIGNSSSGLTEAPTFRVGTVNIGDRQRGRLRAASVIDCAADRSAIGAALGQLYSPEFRARLAHVSNPYGEGGASARIVALLRSQSLDGIVKKVFYQP
jgi:GDP/UDP-N,N'-diacetylbacillosamine 2-epimerase (hydrolysing)